MYVRNLSISSPSLSISSLTHSEVSAARMGGDCRNGSGGLLGLEEVA